MSDRRITRGFNWRAFPAKSVIAAALCVTIFARPTPAQDQPEPPADDRVGDPEARRDHGDPPTGEGRPADVPPRPGGFGPDQREPSEAEFKAAADAMRKHAPNWWRRFENAPPGAPRRRLMMRAVVERHRELQRIEKRDPEQHAREIRQLELEDEILGLAPRLWRERDSAAGDFEEMKSRLREKVEQLIDLRIQNREARLERLTETLNAEKRRLEADKQARDKTVEQRYQAILNRKLEPVFPRGPGRPGGGRTPRGDGGGPDGGAILAPPPGPDQGLPPPPARDPGRRERRDDRRDGGDDDRPQPPPLPPPPPPGSPQD